jgi:DNA repair protein RadD
MITRFKLDGVHTRGGEYISGELADRMDVDELTRSACREIIQYGQDRKSWIIYCSGVQHAHNVATELWAQGITAVAVSGEDPPGERDRKITGFKSGNIQAITNCDLLTTGFNHPEIDLLVMLRPTKSTGLYVQIAGRGMRTAPEKENCLILDFAGNIERHGPIDLVSPIEKRAAGIGEKGVAPTKICRECKSIIFAGFSICPVCGHEFPVREPDHEPTATDADPMSGRDLSKWVDVDAVDYAIHYKGGMTPSLAASKGIPLPTPTLRVEYSVIEDGLGKTYREWVCVEHTGFARQKATGWFRKRNVGYRNIPGTVEEAVNIAYSLPIPERIMLQRDGKYWRVLLSQGWKSNPANVVTDDIPPPPEDNLGFEGDTPF